MVHVRKMTYASDIDGKSLIYDMTHRRWGAGMENAVSIKKKNKYDKNH